MLPLFKSHYSIGKSILTLEDPEKEKGADSIFKICLDENLKDFFLIEDSPIGFLKAKSLSEKLSINLIFGLRLKISSYPELVEEDDSIHKIVILSKSSKGINILNKIYSSFFCEGKGVGNYKILKSLWSNEDLILAVPFYDSFLYYNNFFFSNCLPDLSFCKPIFFIEDNNLPYDSLLKEKVEKYCCSEKYALYAAKSIYYKLDSDVEAFQTYKCICNRSFGKKRTLSNPGLNNFGSNNFSFESWSRNREKVI